MTIDLTGVRTKADFHYLCKDKLRFPDWYGVSWDAFWDAVIAIADMPPHLTLTNWNDFALACPRDMDILRDIIQEYNETMASKQKSMRLDSKEKTV